MFFVTRDKAGETFHPLVRLNESGGHAYLGMPPPNHIKLTRIEGASTK